MGLSAAEYLKRKFEEALFLDQKRQQEQRVAERGHGLKLNPSVSDQGKCLRQVWYSLRNVTPTNPPDAASLINFKIGHAAEEAFAELMELVSGEVVREARVELPTEHTVVSGRKDFQLIFPDRKIIVELKTTSKRNLGWMKKNKEKGKTEHRAQLLAYLAAAGEGWSGVLVYIVKDAAKGNDAYAFFDVERDPDTTAAELEILDWVSQQETVPARASDFKIDKFPCFYCEFVDHCWGRV